MPISVSCPDCEKSLKVKDELAGKKVRCPGCSASISIPSPDADDDFLDDLQELPAKAPKKKRRRSEDEDDEATPKKEPKKSRKSKSGSSVWPLVIGLSGLGAIFVVVGYFVVGLVGTVAQKVAEHEAAQWKPFEHPSGFCSIDMPAKPKRDTKDSLDQMEEYALATRRMRMSLMAGTMPHNESNAFANPDVQEKLFHEMETRTPLKMKAVLVSSRRLLDGAYPGLEMKMNMSGDISLIRFYLVGRALVCAEYVTRNEFLASGERDRFFSSLRASDGTPLIGTDRPIAVPAQPAPPNVQQPPSQ